MKSPDAVDLDTIVVQTKDLFSSELDGDTLLMSLTQAAYYGLDSTGQHIWNMLAEPSRVGDLCDRLVANYDVERATCEQDVLASRNLGWRSSGAHHDNRVSRLPKSTQSRGGSHFQCDE